ncbi:MAG TPA: F0F1 ATP synthase subunit B [Nitrolancea sp.]|jgi:F-type H+-transporting ATPase subunit b|nr:F0F1 ATP synthase subunit B [Nitrolancea sp.]
MSALGVDGWTLIAQLIAFIVFLTIFWKLALGPLTNMIDQRRNRIEESMQAAERMQRELAATQARNEEVLGEARREAQRLLATARENVEQTLARAREQAQVEANRIAEQERAMIAAEREQSWQQLRQEVADLAITAATKIVRKELDRAQQARLIEETLAEASGEGRFQA